MCYMAGEYDLPSWFLFRHTMIASEAPTYEKIIGYGTAYCLWLTSAGLMIVSGAMGLLKQRQAD